MKISLVFSRKMNKRLISLLLTIIIFFSGGIGVFKGGNPLNDLQINGTENAEEVAGFTAGNPLAMGLASAAGNAIKQGINKGFEQIDVGEVVTASATAGVTCGLLNKVRAAGKVILTTAKPSISNILSTGAKTALEFGAAELGGQVISNIFGSKKEYSLEAVGVKMGIGFVAGSIV